MTSPDTTNTSICIFCKIAKKEIPAHIVSENADFIAFLDIRPISAGHTLVIPKQHHRWVWDVTNAGEYFEFARRIARAQKKAFNVEAIHSKIVGEEVPHAHIWLYPSPDEIKIDPKDFGTNQKLIISALEK